MINGMTVPEYAKPTPGGILVEAGSRDEAIAKARAWAEATTEWEVGPRELSVFPNPNHTNMDGASALLVRVNFDDDDPRVAAALSRESDVMAARRGDVAARDQGMVSFMEAGTFIEQNRRARRNTPTRRVVRLVIVTVLGLGLLAAAIQSSGGMGSWIVGAVMFGIVLFVAYGRR